MAARAWSDSKFQAELKKLGDEKNAAFQSKGRDAAFDEIWAIGNRFIKGMLKGALLDHTEDPRLISGIESILSAMLQSSYDAFEAAVADAWIETINHDKKAAKAWAKDSANQKKNLSVSEIADIGFNLSGGFGTFLQQRNKVAFHSLEDIKRAYSQAFKGQADQCFSRDLAEAAEVRHLVTHRGGLIDRKFKNATKTFPEYQLLQEGTYLQLKGPLVKRLATACVDSAVALLKYCDERLSSVSAS
ncbi:MAG: hypothetical protein HIU85_12320 [Proteobacteria bacterium]|nr:hypothetical protein [Pseudomonadota bacterium]